MRPTTRVLRTVVQTVVALAAAAPLVVDALGVDKTAGAAAVIVGVSALIARVMAIPEVDRLLHPLLRSDR